MKLATLCYIKNENSYLMMYRNKKENDMHEGKWVGLGGKFEPGESPEECVIREVYEECGLKLTNPRLRGFMTFPGDAGSFMVDDWYVFLFIANEFEGSISECNEGTLQWIAKDELDNLPMHEGDRHFLKWLDEYENIFSAKQIYVDGVLVSSEVVIHG